MRITVQRFRDARGWGLRVYRDWHAQETETAWRVATREALTDEVAGVRLVADAAGIVELMELPDATDSRA